MTIHQSFLIQKACNFRQGLRLEISIKGTQCIIGPKKKKNELLLLLSLSQQE